ncbi:MAG: HDOD domain-containing protein [Pirellulaceae bacterium]
MHPPLTDTDVLANEVKERVLDSVGEISVLPSVAAEALQMARDPECSTAAFALLIEKDIKLAAEILAFSNSPLLGGRNNTTSLKHAVVRLGFRQCRNLIMSSCASSLMKELDLEEEWIREILWHHSHTTATACTILNRVFDLGFNGEEFTTGLLHDFGRLLFAIAQPDEFREIDKLDMLNDELQLQRERKALSIDHCEIAAWFFRYSHLPEDIVRVIELHHTDSTTLLDQDPQLAKLVALVRAGDHLANHIQTSENPSEYDAESNDGLRELAHSKGSGVFQRFTGSLNEILKEINANVGEKP